MNSISYEDYKYMLQDTGHLYIGSHYTYRELMGNPEMNFKFKAIIEQYLFKEVDPDTTLESDFYYMKKDSFEYRTYEQLKIRVKANVLVNKKHFFGKCRLEYQEKTYSLEDFVNMSLAVKKRDGIMVQEIIFNKLALMGFII